MIIILDVSAAVEILLLKEKKEIFQNKVNAENWVIAPDLFISEISNVLWKYYKANIISHEECIQFVEDGINMIDDFHACHDLWKEALGESIKNAHSVYDMFYVILARRNDGTLLTNDKKLSGICNRLNVEYVI